MGESSREMRFGISSPPGSTTQKGRGDASATATATAASSASASASASAGRSIIPDETNSSSDFNQWLHAMKMVARLPGGMPPEFRRKLWLALADKYLKSKNVDWEKEEVKCFSEQWREDDEELGIQIVKDLHRTGSSLCSGPAGTLNQAKLKRILLGYARFNPEVGYCQGFNMLGALILQVMDKEEIESIKVMIYLVEGILPSGYFSGSLGGLQADMAVFRELMTSKLPRLAKHLQKLQGPVENAFEPPLTNVFTMQWFLTMFCTCLPMTCVLRVWDLVLIEGSDVLLRTALVLWSLLEERILSARTADDFYCQMGSFSSELLNGHLVDSNGLIEKVVDLGPIKDLQKLRDKHLYNITPFRDKKGLQLYYSDEDGDSDEDSKLAVATAWGLRLRRGSAGLGSKIEGKDRMALDISLLKKQYDRLRERQRQAHIILTSAVARQGSNANQSSLQMNQLLMGRNAIVTNNGRRLGPPQGAIPPARKPSLPTSKPPKLAQTKKLLSGETLHWRDTDLSKRRRGSLKWKDIKPDSFQSGMEDRPATLIESAPSSRSSSSEPKSRRTTLKASRQRSDSSSYSEESDGNSSTSTSLCDDDEVADNNVSSLEGSPMRKVKSSRKHSEVSKQKSLEDVLNSNDGQPTIDNQIPFIQLTTIESPVLNANKTDIDPRDYGKEDSETESNRLDYAGFVDDFSWPDMNEPTSSVSLEDTTIDATSAEGDFLSLSNVITSTSQLSPIPDITTYINNSNISPLRTPISSFNYASLVVNMDESKKFDVNEEGVTNEYFERVNIVERPTKLDLLYSLNEEDSIRNAYVSREPSPDSSKDVENLKTGEPEISNTIVSQISDEERDRKMKVLQEYSNKSSLSFIAEAKQEISSGMFKEVEFDVESLKYQPSTLVPIKKQHLDLKPDCSPEHVTTEKNGFSKPDRQTEDVSETKRRNLGSPQICSPPKNLAEELAEIEFASNTGKDRKLDENVHHAEVEDTQQKSHEEEVLPKVTNNIPSTEDLETRFRALEMNFSGRKDSLSNKAKEDLPTSKEISLSEEVISSKKSIDEIDKAKPESATSIKDVPQVEPLRKSSNYSSDFMEEVNTSKEKSSVGKTAKEDVPLDTLNKEEKKPLEDSTTNEFKDKEKYLEVSKSLPLSESTLDQSITALHEKTNSSEKSRENIPKPKEKDEDLSSSSPKKEVIQNLDTLVQHEGGIRDNQTSEMTQNNLETKTTQFKESPYTNLETSDLLPDGSKSVFNSELEQSQPEELLKEDSNDARKQSLLSYKEEHLLHKKSLVEHQTVENQDDLLNEEKLTTNNTKSLTESSIPKEDIEDLSSSRYSKEHINDDWKSSDYRYQYKSPDEDSKQLDVSANKESSSKFSEGDNEGLHPSSTSSTEPIIDKNSKSTGLLSEEKCLEQKHQQSTVEELKKEDRTADGREASFSEKEEFNKSESSHEASKSCFQTTKHEGDFEEELKLMAKHEGLHLKQEKNDSLTNFKESVTEDPKSFDILSRERVETVPKNETASIKNEHLSSNKGTLSEHPKPDDVETILETSKMEKPSLSTPLRKLSADFKQNIVEDTVVKNLSDDSKRSLLPKEVKEELQSPTAKKLPSEGVLFFEHHPANEYGSENEGLNDPKPPEEGSIESQPTTKVEPSSSHEITTCELELVEQEKSIVPSTTSTENSDSKALQKLNEKEPKLAPITTVDKPLSTYSFSYTQDQFKDQVSFLSEIQSSADQETGAVQSTFDMKHSLHNLVAVTTSVSVRNATSSVKSSVSIKSSVSLKSSSLYDRERSLNVNAGITVFENPKIDDSQVISTNQLELSEGNKRVSEDNLRLNHNLLSNTQNNEVSVSLVQSKYKGIQSANTSNISLSMQLPNYSGSPLIRNQSKTEAILEREVLQITDDDSLEKRLNKSDNESCKDQIQAKVNDEESQKRKSSYSKDIDERLRALERRFSDRALSESKETKKQLDQSTTTENEPKKEQILTLDDVQPSKLETDAAPSRKPSPEKETETKTAANAKEEPEKIVPSTADLEHRFAELERKLSEKNIHLPAKNEEKQQEASASKKGTSTLNPSIVLSKNEDTSPVRECDGSSNNENLSQAKEDQQSTTRRRIPSTEDLETRFEALEIQKSLKSPTNLLSPSKIKEDFSVAITELESNRKSEIPSTEDLENRFQALEESKKGGSTLQTKPCPQKKESENSIDSQDQMKPSSNGTKDKEHRFKTKEMPKVTFADSSDVKLMDKKSSENIDIVDKELITKTAESPTTCEFGRERILRKVPSARDLEARFEALEKRKSFTGFSTKTQEHLLAEQNRNYLSSDSINSIESLKRRELNDKKVASTEDLVLRLDALEHRLAITENSIKNKISAPSEASDSLQTKPKKCSPKFDFECRFEALDKPKSFNEACIEENTSTNRTYDSQQTALVFPKDASEETKLNFIKRSLFEDKQPEPRWLPSTEDLESRFDALEKQKNKTLSSKKKIVREKEEMRPKSTHYEEQTKSTQNWETRFEAFEHRTPRMSSYSKTVPTLDKETHSKFPSTRDLESRFEALEQQKSIIDRSAKLKDLQKRFTNENDFKPSPLFSKPIQQEIDQLSKKALSSRSIDKVLEQISTKTDEIEREHQMVSKVPSTQDLEIRYHDLQIQTKRGDDPEQENVQHSEQTTDSLELTGNHKRRDLYKLESQSDETLTVSDPTGTEFETKSESRPTSCPEYRDPFDSNIVTTDRVLKIIEENSKILHRILKKTLADSGGNGNSAESVNSRSGFADSLLALGNIFPRNEESISPSRIKSQSRVRSTITFRSEDNSITDRLASIKSTIKSIDTLCEDQSSRKDKCQRYIDSLFTPRPSNPTSPTPPIARPLIKVDEFESGSSSGRSPAKERVALRELKKETSPRRRRDEDREEYESRVRRDMMPNNVDAPSELSCSLENIAKVDSEVDRINQDKQVETQLERPLSPYYAPGYDLNNRSITPVVYIPTKLEIRHTTVTSTFYDRYLTEKHIERTFPRSKKHSPVSPTITKSHLDISNFNSPDLDDRSSKSAENSPSRRKDGLSPSPNQTVSAAAYRRSFISSLEVAQKDLHIRSCDNILLQLRSSTHNKDVVPSIMVYNPLPTKIRKSPELGISLGLYKDFGSDASSKS